MATLCTQEIADKVGQTKPEKDAADAYDKAAGKYHHEHDHGKTTPLPHPPSPLKLGK